MNFSRVFLTVYLSSWSLFLPAQAFHFQLFDTQDGLLSTRINALLQDDEGYLWIGTDVGICQYDGYEFKCYTVTNGLPKGRIIAIAKSMDGAIWIATEQGIARFKKEKFKKIAIQRAITSLYIDKKNNIWVGTNDGLAVLRVKNQLTAIEQATTSFFEFSPQTFSVFKIAEDLNGSILIGTDNLLFRINENQIDTIHENTAQLNNYFQTILPLEQGGILAGTNHGEIIIFKDNKKELYIPQSSNIINILGFIPFENNIWALHEEGFLIIKPDHSYVNYSLYQQLKVKQMQCMIKDRENNFWIGTQEGLVRVTPRDFELYPELNDLMPSGLFAIGETPDKNLMIASNYSRIYTKKLNDKRFSKMDIPVLPSYAEIVGMLYDKNGDFWLTTYWKGVFRIKGNDIDQYWYEEGITDGADMNFSCLDISGNIWLGHNYGLTTIAISTNGDVNITNPAEVANKKFFAYTTEINGQIWFGGDAGIYALESGKLIKHSLRNDDITVTGLSFDNEARLWVATQGNGLFCYRRKKEKLVLDATYNTENGLISNFLLDVKADWNGNIWVGSYQGISVLRKNKKSFQVTNYTPEDGLIKKAYKNIILYEDQLGVMWAVTTMGLMSFDGNSIKSNEVEPLIHLSKVNIHGKPYPFNSAKKLILSHTQNSIDFHLTAISLKNPKKIKYQYKIEGMQGWSPVRKQREISFNQLSPGNYTLFFRACNNDQIWNSKPQFFHFQIKPPFWLTWWFLVILMSAIVLAIIIFVKRREKTIKSIEAEKSRVNQLVAELETKALRAQMNPHFTFNSLNAIQECIVTEEIDTAYDYLLKFSSLLRKVLNSSSKSLITIESELEILHLYLALEGLRFDDKFSYEIKLEDNEELEEMYIPSLMIQPFVENSIWHGLLHKKGERNLIISFYTEGDSLVCCVEDNGIGRKAAKDIRKKKKFKHESMALQLINDRLKIIEQQTNKLSTITIIDLIEENSKPVGTRVEIRIPNDLIPKTI